MSTKNDFGKFWMNVPLKGLLYISIIINFACIVAIFLLKNLLPPVVPILYGRPTGEGQLLPTFGLSIAPMVSLGIIVLNLFMGRVLKESFNLKIFIAAGFLVSVLSAITVLKIILLVGFF